jgi:methylmalonyl-CoA/ethylmalonyl-CoA epimerase
MARKINQIGIVVKNMDQAVKMYKDLLGVDNFQVLDRPPETCTLRGQEVHFRLRTGFAMLEGGLQIELIQVVEGHSAHSEFLEQHGPGVHHVGFYVDDIEAEIANAMQSGISVYARGEFMGTKFVYLDTIATAGIFQELIQLPKPRVRAKK